MDKKLIGILGGMGPEAGIALSRNVVAHTIAKNDQDHIPQILFSVPEDVPDRTAFLTGKTDTNPGYPISALLIRMESFNVQYAGIACNSAHAPQIFNIIVSELRNNNSKIRLFHIIDEVGKFIRHYYEGIRKVGILGTTGTYLTRQYDLVNKYDLETINLSEIEQESLQDAIFNYDYGIKSNPGVIHEKTRRILNDSINSLIQKGSEIVVLGCTELPLAFTDAFYNDIPVIDSSVVLGRALIKAHSPGKLKPWIT